MLDDLGLVEAVKWHAKKFLNRSGINAHFTTEGKQRRFPAEIETAIFRIVQEATTNILKHAAAKNVNIELIFRRNAVEVYVQDDGRGFNPEQITHSAGTYSGFGLLNMRERSELLGGRFTLESELGIGTEIKIEIPG